MYVNRRSNEFFNVEFAKILNYYLMQCFLSLQVCKGDRIIVDVTNALSTETTTIHWHGLHMRGRPWMDGVPSITQCPILPGHTFRYEFPADIAGSFIWHSHSGEFLVPGFSTFSIGFSADILFALKISYIYIFIFKTQLK